MASSVDGYAKLVNGAGGAAKGQQVYIGRRTGQVIKINARKDSCGFDRIEDYFPDSESDEEENKSTRNVKPIKLKPNQYIGRRTGNVIEINARKDSHGFELIEDYFPDSIRECDNSIFSNKDVSNASKLSVSMNTSERSKKNQEGEAVEDKENRSHLLNSGKKSHGYSSLKGIKDILSPLQKELDISTNLTGTAVKNSDTSGEPSPQFFGSKKRLFPSVENNDITRETITEAEEDVDIVGVSDEEEEEANAQSGDKIMKGAEDDIDIVGVSDEEEEEANAQSGDKIMKGAEDDIDIVGVSDEEEEEANAQSGDKIMKEGEDDIDIVGVSDEENAQNRQNANKQKEKNNCNEETEDSIVLDVVGGDTTCITLHDKSRGPKIKGAAQKDEEDLGRKTKDDTLIVDIEDDSTFLTLGNKSKVSKLKSMSHDDSVPDNEQSYQMDESVVLEGTKHKTMSPDFGSVSDHSSGNSGAENDVTRDRVKPKGRQTRKSKKSVSKKSFKEQKQEDDENEDNDADKTVGRQVDNATRKPAAKKATRSSKKSASSKSIKEKQDEGQENITVNITSGDHANEDDVSHVSIMKKATRKSKKSVSNKSIKEKEEEENQEDICANMTSADHTNEDDVSHVSIMKKATRKSKKSVSNKSIKEKEEEENQEDICANITGADQANEDDTVHVSPVKKATRNSKKSVSNKSIKEQQVVEDQDSEMAEETKANQETRDERRGKTRAAKRSTRNTQKDQDSDITAAAVEEKKEEPDERIKTRRVTRSNASNLANITSNKKNGKKASLGRSARLKSKSMAFDKSSDSVFEELKNEKNASQNKNMGAVEDEESNDVENEYQGEEDGNISVPVDMEDGMPEDVDCQVNDTDVHDHIQGGDECAGTLKDRARKKKSNDNRSASQTEEVHEAKNISKNQSTRNKSQVNNKSGSETEELQETECHDDGSYDAHGDDEEESQEILKKPAKSIKRAKGKKTENKGAAWRAMLNNNDEDDDDGHDDDAKESNKDQDDNVNSSKTISKNANKKSKGNKKNTSSSSASDSEKDRVDEKNRIPKRKRKAIKKVAMTIHPRRKPKRTNSETTGSDVTDQEGTADEGNDVTKENESRPNDTPLREIADKTMNKSLGKRANQTRIESLRAAETSTPVGSPYILPPGSVKSILKSSVPKTMSADGKKPRVSIAANQKDSIPGADVDDDDEGGRSRSPGRPRKSSVSFAPTPSFRIAPDDFSTPEESPDELGQFSFVTNYSGFSVGDNTFTPGVISSTSLSSSATSHASVSDPALSDTSSVNESQEITISSAKKRQVEEEEVQDDSGVRRSKRTKVPPLEYWKNERIKYERRKSGWFVSGIEKAPTPNFPKRKPKKPRNEKKRGGRKSDSYEEANDFHDEPADMEEVAYTSIPVINPDNGEQVELDLVHTPQMSNFVNVSGKTATREDLLIVDKFMSHNLFGAGQIVLRPGAVKGKQHVRDDTMVFYVVKGPVEVTVHESTVLLPTGSTFFVPTGNFYNIKNVQNSDARLMFVQIKG